MLFSFKGELGKPLLIITTLIGAMTVSGTATSAEYWTPANAPITYKMANPNDLTGYNPAYTPQITHIPQYQASGPTFDQNQVDQTLYSHQRIGRPYTVAGKTYTPKHQPRYDMVGTASWYGDKFHGKLTANGEIYDKNGMTAAHKTLPLNSLVVVTNLKTGAALTLRINDRGPFVGNRIIDLSEAAAKVMGITQTGLGEVRVQYAGPADPSKGAKTSPRAAQPLAPRVSQPQVMAPQNMAPQNIVPQMRSPQAAQQQVMRPAHPPIVPQYQRPSAPQLQYQPLREMNPPLPQAPKAAELAPPLVQVPNIMNPVSIVPQAALPVMPYSAPEAYMPPSNGRVRDDTVVTMTIKGPIHMATHGARNARGQLFQVVNRTTYKTIK